MKTSQTLNSKLALVLFVVVSIVVLPIQAEEESSLHRGVVSTGKKGFYSKPWPKPVPKPRPTPEPPTPPTNPVCTVTPDTCMDENGVPGIVYRVTATAVGGTENLEGVELACATSDVVVDGVMPPLDFDILSGGECVEETIIVGVALQCSPDEDCDSGIFAYNICCPQELPCVAVEKSTASAMPDYVLSVTSAQEGLNLECSLFGSAPECDADCSGSGTTSILCQLLSSDSTNNSGGRFCPEGAFPPTPEPTPRP